jgi:hypothetical protein
MINQIGQHIRRCFEYLLLVNPVSVKSVCTRGNFKSRVGLGSGGLLTNVCFTHWSNNWCSILLLTVLALSLLSAEPRGVVFLF